MELVRFRAGGPEDPKCGFARCVDDNVVTRYEAAVNGWVCDGGRFHTSHLLELEDSEANSAMERSKECATRSSNDIRVMQSKKTKSVDQFELIWPIVMAQPYETEAQLYAEVRGFFEAHVDFVDARHFDVLASVVLLTYRLREFDKTPYIFLLGPPNSGKTRVLECLKELCNLPLLSSTLTPAAIYQCLSMWHPTLLLDETELYRLKSERAVEIQGILNAGYRRGQFAIRGSKDGNEPKLYDVFGLKAMAGIEPIYVTVMQRCLIINMEKTLKELPLSVHHALSERLRAQLEYYASHHELVSMNEDGLAREIGDARVAELFIPLIAVAPTRESQTALISLAKETALGRLEDEQTGIEAEVLKAILDCKGLVEDGKLPVKAIVDKFNEGRDEREHARSDWVGRKLQRLGLRKARIGHAALRGIYWDEILLRRLRNRYLPGLSVEERVNADTADTATNRHTSFSIQNHLLTCPIRNPEEASAPSALSAHHIDEVRDLPVQEENVRRLRGLKSAPTLEHFKDYAATLLSNDRHQVDRLVERLRREGKLLQRPDGGWEWS